MSEEPRPRQLPARRGPSTPEGRAALRMNALRHGLHRSQIALPGGEDAVLWERFHSEAVDALAPEGAIEFALAARIAESFWRLRRVGPAETQMVIKSSERERLLEERRRNARRLSEQELAGTFYASAIVEQGSSAGTLAQPRLLPEDTDLQQLIRYEAHLNRQLYQAMHELEALQDRRRGNVAPLARMDVHGIPVPET